MTMNLGSYKYWPVRWLIKEIADLERILRKERQSWNGGNLALVNRLNYDLRIAMSYLSR